MRVARNAHVTLRSATPPLDYDRLREALTASGAVVALAELHGGVCGVLCAGGAEAARRWLAELLDDEQLTAVPGALADDLDGLVATSAKMLDDRDLAFTPLLPSDDSPLDEQVEALAAWCQGFVSGVGTTRASAQRSTENAALDEILRDFAEIGRAGLSEEEAAGETQADFALAEIHEFVRVGVQIVFEELASERALSAPDVH
jgi:uncharacterized protein YgfB (UPF0149 family)